MPESRYPIDVESLRFPPASDPQEVTDALYTYFDALLRAGRFLEVDALLAHWPVGWATVDTMLSLLTVTLPAHSKLPRRHQFFSRVSQQLRMRQQHKPELLAGLIPEE